MADDSYIEQLEALVVTSARNADNTERMERYHEALFAPEGKQALEYLMNERGFVESTIKHFKLGYVHNPLPIDRQAQGYISIPYTNPAGVFDVRFRRGPSNSEDAPKYWQPAGSTQTIFNVEELEATNDFIIVTEGELCAVGGWQIGLPTVAYPGVKSVKNFHRHLFEGFERVYLCGDGDEAGQGFNAHLAELLRNAYPIAMPPGEDLDSFAKKHGAVATRKLILGE